MTRNRPNAKFEGYPARVYTRSDGRGQIIYGESNQLHAGKQHGHVSFDPESGSVDYWREPQQSHSDWSIDGKRGNDHTKI